MGLHSLTGLAGTVRISWSKAGSTEDISGAQPSAGTVSCPVAELKASEASCAIHVSPSAAWKYFENKGSIKKWINGNISERGLAGGLYSCEIANVTGSEDNKCRVASERDRINCHRV